MGILSALKQLFTKKTYGPYTLKSERTYKVPIRKQIPDPKAFSHTDPMDFISVDTGKSKTFVEETWVAYEQTTNLPKYKTITREI